METKKEKRAQPAGLKRYQEWEKKRREEIHGKLLVDFPDVLPNGAPRATVHNGIVALRALGFECRLNEFTNKIEIWQRGKCIGQVLPIRGNRS